MIDSVLSLLDNGHEAEIFAISRRGLVPSGIWAVSQCRSVRKNSPRHQACQASQHIRALMRKVEQKAETGVMSWMVCARTQRLWSGLSVGQKVRFLRHLRPWWDVHRHRMAPAAADRIAAAVKSGQLKVMAGRLVLFVRTVKILLSATARAAGRGQMLRVAAIIDCRGGNQHFRRPATRR